MPHVTGILETCLSVADVERSAHFYERLFGFERMVSDDRFCAFAVTAENSRGEEAPAHDVLILFRKGAAAQPVALPGGVIPGHDDSGHSHFAFAIRAEDLPAWEKRLAEAGVPIESRVHWELGGESLYFRDPDGHLAELATPGIWPIY
jgi:catechol 2,3-dioxygenase-like lactoylglutathione lyase family enzyme